jgi:hypothetical protein
MKPLIAHKEKYYGDKKKIRPYHKQWVRLVENFTGRKMSLYAEKLLAIAAIASWFQRKLSDQYVVGLWKSTILFDMMWKPVNNAALDEDHPRCRNACGPSWSWVSFDGRVEYTSAWWLKDFVAQFKDVLVPLVYEFAPFGQVGSCSIIIESHIRQVKLRGSTLLALKSDMCPVVATFFADYPSMTAHGGGTEEYFCLVIGTFESTSPGVVVVSGIVLRKSQRDYERIGIFESYDHFLGSGSVVQAGCICPSSHLLKKQSQVSTSNRRTLAFFMGARKERVTVF